MSVPVKKRNQGKLTLARSPFGIVATASDLPTRFIVHLGDQHDGQVSTTGGRTLLRASLEESRRPAS